VDFDLDLDTNSCGTNCEITQVELEECGMYMECDEDGYVCVWNSPKKFLKFSVS